MRTTLFTLSVLGLVAGVGLAQIKRYTLDEMVGEMDDAVYGQIIERRVERIDHPIDGPELYFTTLTIEGRSLKSGTPMTVEVAYHGGFVSEDEGVYNSEAPAEDDVQLGNRVVAFYRWSDNMGGEFAANALIAAHGGLYRTLEGPHGAMVLGRGAGYAVNRNLRIGDLDADVTRIFQERPHQGHGK